MLFNNQQQVSNLILRSRDDFVMLGYKGLGLEYQIVRILQGHLKLKLGWLIA